MKTLYWCMLAALAYTWMGYLLLLLALKPLARGRAREDGACAPCVTVLLTVHNEQEVVGRRIGNILESDYPEGLIDVLVASDGSTDGTDAAVESIAAKDGRVRLFRADRGGKSAAQNQAMPFARGTVVVITDAETVFEPDTIGKLASAFADETAGCASGRLVLTGPGGTVSEGQGMYWRFEMLLRRLESRLGLLHTASGSVMAFRKSAFKPFEPSYGDDCVIPLDVLAAGYRVVHVDDAIAYDAFPATMASELRTRTRMTLRNITGTLSRRQLLNPLAHPCLSAAIMSHKVLRWLTPFFMIGMFAANALLLEAGLFYKAVFALQVSFYLFGAAGYVAEKRHRRMPVASQVFSFLLANAGFFLGVIKGVFGQRVFLYRSR